MTWPTEQAREAVAQVRELRFGLAFGLPGDVSPDVVHDAVLAALAPHVAALVRAERAAAVREAAEAWLHGAWGDTPRRADRVADRMAAAQFVGDWLHARAAAEEADR